MSRAQKLIPELQVPPLLVDVLVDYMGPRRFRRLSPRQASQIQFLAGEFGRAIGGVIGAEGGKQLRDPPGGDEQPAPAGERPAPYGGG